MYKRWRVRLQKGRFYKTELGKIKLNEITSIQQIQMPQTFAFKR